MDHPWKPHGTPWTSMEFNGTPWGYFTRVIFISLMQKSSFSLDNNVIIGTHVEVVYQRTADECFMNI